MNKETCKSKVIIMITYIYMLLPFLIFSIGWFRIYISVPVTLIVLFCGWKAWKDTPAFWMPELKKSNIIKIIFICIIIALWVFLSGIGKMVFQNSDHYWRNSIFEILVEYKWPVYNTDIQADMFPEGTAITSLIYYIGFWMPAAVVGKFLGIQAGFIFQMIWAFIGILLVYYYMCARKNRLMAWPLVLLIFFSGLDILGGFIPGRETNIFNMPNDLHLEWWAAPYQYSSMTTQLFWVFNQAVPAWLCTVFAMQQKNNRSLVLILSTALLNSTLPFIGLLIFTVFWMFSRNYGDSGQLNEKGAIKAWSRGFFMDSFTIQNVLGGGVIGIISFLYLKGNSSGTHMGLDTFLSIEPLSWIIYLAFFIVECGIYLFLIYKYQRENSTYLVTFVSLLMIPVIKGGGGNEFCMRVSIPALFILMLLIQDSLEIAKMKKDRVVFIGLVISLCVGSVTPVHEFRRTINNTAKYNESSDFIKTIPHRDILNQGNFSGSISNRFFFDYIAKKQED